MIKWVKYLTNMESAGIEQQIADLEKKLQEKKTFLEQRSSNTENLPSEKEILHEIVGEKIQQHVLQYTPKSPVQTPPPPQVQDTPSYFSQELKDKVQELINIVFDKSVDEGIKMAVNRNNPALLDAFHDVLVDELYNTLLERRKIQPVN